MMAGIGKFGTIDKLKAKRKKQTTGGIVGSASRGLAGLVSKVKKPMQLKTVDSSMGMRG